MSVRTTLTLPDDVYGVARNLAALRGISMGDAVGELVRKGLTAGRFTEKGVFPTFEVSESARPFGLSEARTDEDE